MFVTMYEACGTGPATAVNRTRNWTLAQKAMAKLKGQFSFKLEFHPYGQGAIAPIKIEATA
jgi:hypothetical protein